MSITTPDHDAPPPELALQVTQQHGLELTRVRNKHTGQRLATFTRGARSVLLHGPSRVFNEPTSPSVVGHHLWVRALPLPYGGTLDAHWLASALGANAMGLPDILGLSMQYLHGAPDIERHGQRIAGEAHYGPLKDNGKRGEGSDFNDYLGVTWTYAAEDRVDQPESKQLGCLDCSGYVRMVWGYRSHAPGGNGMPLCHRPRADASAIPRRANEMFFSGPGVIVMAHAAQQVTQLAPLQAGDLVFFDGDADDGARLDHVGMFIGTDAAGQHRFISSRKQHNGPTFGDAGGKSVLDGHEHYARALRAARRF